MYIIILVLYFYTRNMAQMVHIGVLIYSDRIVELNSVYGLGHDRTG